MQIPLSRWQLVTDGVMGGMSRGRFDLGRVDNHPCLHLTGEVSTRNNGGFIQIAHDLDAGIVDAIRGYCGIRLLARGNGQEYNLHLRTRSLLFPWQAYRATFATTNAWTTVSLPFKTFGAYRTSAKFDPQRLSRVGIVAIGREFAADICVAQIGFYRE